MAVPPPFLVNVVLIFHQAEYGEAKCTVGHFEPKKLQRKLVISGSLNSWDLSKIS